MVTEPANKREAFVEREPIQLPSVTDVVHERLHQDIARGDMKPGLIRLKDIAARFNVSTMPVREALRRLEAEGLVSFTNNRRIVVRHLSVADLEEIFAIRIELEGLAVERAVNELQKDLSGIRELEDLVEFMDRQVEDRAEWREANRRFHFTLYQKSDLHRLVSLIGTLWTSAEPYLRLYASNAPTLTESQAIHRQLLAAIASNDPGHARAIMRVHLMNSRAQLISVLREDGTGA